MPLPQVHYGTANQASTDFRTRDDQFDDSDDDSELATTPTGVAEMLGFDPLG